MSEQSDAVYAAVTEEWSEATLYSVYAVEMDIGTYLRSELRELETEAEP